jgi:nicotinamide phosphoribosyltransferase
MFESTSAAFLIDFYKVSHAAQYPNGTQYVYSNFTPRAANYNPIDSKDFDGKVVFLGLQPFIDQLEETWNYSFFFLPKEEALIGISKMFEDTVGPQPFLMKRFAELHDIGYLPIQIKALPEGSRVPLGVPYFTIINTDPKAYWLTNYLETHISNYIWRCCTSATIAYHYRKMLTKFAIATGGDVKFVNWQGHDFSYRGMSGFDDAVLSGIGHLASFTGTDTVPAIDFINKYYYGKDNGLIGASVPATEHSVMSAGGMEDELETYRRLLTEVHPTGILSIVSDTWDLWKVVTEFLPTLKDIIIKREGKLVIRPDSGDPVDILCGTVDIIDGHKYRLEGQEEWTLSQVTEAVLEDIVCKVRGETPYGESGEDYPVGYFRYKNQIYKLVTDLFWNRHDKKYYYMDGFKTKSCNIVNLTPAEKGLIECLWETFGGTLTSTGHKLLDNHIGAIYGDSITYQRAKQILTRLAAKGFASTNVVFGIGSFTYVHTTRDTFGHAMKATMAIINDQERPIFKNPATDNGQKKSARGWLKVIKDSDNNFKLLDNQSAEEEKNGELRTVFHKGTRSFHQSFQQIRNTLYPEEF